MAMPGITLGTVGATQITTAKLSAGVFDSMGSYRALTQITMTANYARTAQSNSGWPRVTTNRPAIDDVASQNSGTVASGKTVWTFTVEANALIAASAAVATGVSA
jgi:hypothetical protein